ncbi:MAG: DUF4081 domain-containing protein, partial [Propionibacteriaceae bacterium]|nr:DUF4081 domain-containing protein [Propionibacteriaceae bacterium]
MRARILTSADTDQVRRILRADPVGNIFVSSRVEAGVLNPHTPGMLWGWPSAEIHSILHVGQNMVPVAADRVAIAAFAEVVGRRRSSQAILGPAGQALPLWTALS